MCIRDRFGQGTGDIAARPQDGALISLTDGNTDAMSGRGIRIDPGDASIRGVVGDDIVDSIITTNQDDGMMMGIGAALGTGINFEAITFGPGAAYGVGNINTLGRAPVTPTNTYEQNILFRFDPLTLQANGEAQERSNDDNDGDMLPDRPFEGADTNIVERGQIDTVNSVAGNTRLIVTDRATLPGPIFFIEDGDQVVTSAASGGVRFELEAGAEITLVDEEVRDGDILRAVVGGTTYDFQFDTGPVLQLTTGAVDGATFRFGNTTYEFDIALDLSLIHI